MAKLITAVKKFVKSEDAPTMVEYGLLVALIAIVAAVARPPWGQSLGLVHLHRRLGLRSD